MNRLLANWAIALAMSFTIVACSKEENVIDTPVDPPTTTPSTERKSVKVSLEADLEEVLRATTTYVNLTVNDQQVPIINLDKMQRDIPHPITGEMVKGIDVNIVIRSDKSTDPITFATVPFVRKGKKLCMASTDVTLAPGTNFTNEGGRKWYILGVLGGSFKPEESSQCVGTDGSKTALGWTTGAFSETNYSKEKLMVPMAMFPWKEITIRKEPAFTQGDAGHNLHFQMMGSLLRIRIKNDLQRSQGSLNNFSGMSLYSNAFSNNGYFLFRGTLEPNGFPEWRDLSRTGQTGTYAVDMINPETGLTEKFAKIDIFGDLAGQTIAHNAYIENIVWVMPRSVTKPATISSLGTMQMGTNPHRYFTTLEGTPTNLTDYSTRVRTSIPKQGQVYTLTTEIKRPVLPLEFVAEHNVGPTPKIFAVDHDKNNQGYYRGVPKTDQSYINAYGPLVSVKLEDAMPDGHHVPTTEELNGIFSVGERHNNGDFTTNVYYANNDSPYVSSEVLETAGNTYGLPAHYKNVCSQSQRCSYALRYMGNDPNNSDDTLLKTAWRYIFYENLMVDGKLYPKVLVVLSRWVGDPTYQQPTYSVSNISNAAWWDAPAPTEPRAYGPVVKRVFVATGKKDEKWNGSIPSHLEWTAQDYVKLGGVFNSSLNRSPRAIFNNQRGATLPDEPEQEHVTIRPFRNPALLGY